MTASDANKPTLQTDGAPAEQLDVVETPTSPSSALALSRFEFETGKANDGSKILMVEWDTTTLPPAPAGKTETEPPLENGDGPGAKEERKESATGDWDVTWEGKHKAVGVRDRETDATMRRVYFFLPPGAHIPPLVSISPRGAAPPGSPVVPGRASRVLRTKPLPAIYPAALGGAGPDAGRRGVLHTIWARKRLAELQAEIVDEMKANGESVGLEMALQERQWLVDHFGLAPAEGARPTKLHIPAGAPVGPASPRSPIGGKLGEKLRGLKLATSPTDLAAALVTASNAPAKGGLPALGTATAGRLPQSSGGIASLDAIVGNNVAAADGQGNTEEDLFALPMSPRSPEMAKSPFSLLK
ncbi:hypothetical protein GQ53DRAFT_407460 [Thozetella sp. PMI_491]|nr:hypothetical protein GQ53DRAFT_407460 [Thozetella sp. PMI_491]